METKRLILLCVVGMLIVLGWTPVMRMLTEKAGYTLPTTQPIVASTEVGSGAAPTTQMSLPSVSPGATTMSVGGWTIGGDPGDEHVEAIGSAAPKDKDFAIEVAVSTIGAGLDRAILNDYKLSLRTGEPFTYERPAAAPFAEQTRALAVRSVTIDGVTLDLTGIKWTLAAVDRDGSKDDQSLTYELPLSREGKVQLVLRRIYVVSKRSAGAWILAKQTAEPKGFEAAVSTSFINKADRPMSVSITFNAPSIPPSEAERYADGTFLIGYAANGVVSPEGHLSDTIRDSADLLKDAKERKPYWFGAATSYFMALQRFDPMPGTQTPSDWFRSIQSRTLTPELHGVDRRNEVIIHTQDATIMAGSESAIASHVYLGPRWRDTLDNAHYSAPWIQYDRALVIISAWCSVCTWQWLIDILFTVLWSFHAIFKDWGVAIIGLVVLVRLALHPITKRAQMNMLKFGKYAPEIAKIKERHKDDQDAMNRAMMGFYKEHGSTQLMGCLPMFLQMPVWIALWQAMNSTFELRHSPFFYNWTWIHDLSKPDHLIDFANFGWAPIHLPFLSFITISGVNILPFIYGIVQFIQFKIQPKPPATTPEQAQQQQMTQWMILFLMPLMLYASPSGLMIYMITSFLIGIFESRRVKKQFEKRNANEARFEIVDAGSPAAARAEKATVRRKESGPKKKDLFGMLEEIREKAMEAQREIEKKKKGR